MTFRILHLAGLLGMALACAGVPAARPGPATRSSPTLSDALATDCYGLPATEPSPSRHAETTTRLETGELAVDFALQDVHGKTWRLSDLLADKPVLLIMGSSTCPRYQENRTADERTARKYGDKVHVVLVYNIEAHPKKPDNGPYHGVPKPKEFSDRRQARSYDDRVRAAGQVADGSSLLVLVDAFDPPGANPVWCTYGTCPSCAWLIGRDGRIVAHHLWHDPATMDRSIDALLSDRP